MALKDQPKESLHLLLDTIDGINRTMELKALLAESMEAIRIVMSSEASSLMLLDEDTGELFVSLPTGPVKEEIKGMSIPKNQGVGGWVVETRRPFLSNNVEETEIFWGDLADDFKTRNILCVPLITKDDKVIGVVQAINRRNNADFTPHDIPVFQSLASHITIAIERARQIDELHNRLKEKEVMLTEIHHRIKNNLGAISGLIEMELPAVIDKHSKEVLQTTYTRIQSMTKVHDLLCQKGLFRDIELGIYLKQLTEKIEDTMGDSPQDIRIDLKAENIHVSANQALLCGLVLNELLVNIYKHAFRGMQSGHIAINLFQKEESVMLDIADDGVGLPDDFEVESGKTIGMWIIDVMLKKLNGTIHVNGEEEEGGSHFHISFPIEE
ncbi:MAG: histidine kinase dimerization/phosphoacceptor domain -containing protein [Balneolaceae bacterium]|nr:histidine kinase dimerization/phosphoacceptor domain -containing protein [Balneolaceae bacterium]